MILFGVFAFLIGVTGDGSRPGAGNPSPAWEKGRDEGPPLII
jgi:hypothetical protein